MTNNPARYVGLKGYGLAIAGKVPLLTLITRDKKRYLETKCAKPGHIYGFDYNGRRNGSVNPNGRMSIASPSDGDSEN